jgi:hypothetical protein
MKCKTKSSDLSTMHAWAVLFAAIVVVAVLSSPARAHHSFATFDSSQVVILEGVVSKIEWTNPHVYFFIEAKDAKGVSRKYTIESGSISLLARKGWKKNSLKIADAVSVRLNPLKDGQPGGLLVSITLSDGTVLKG